MDLTILAIRYDDDAEGMNIETQIMHKIYLESHKQWTPHVGKVPHFRPNGFVARTRGVFGGAFEDQEIMYAQCAGWDW